MAGNRWSNRRHECPALTRAMRNTPIGDSVAGWRDHAATIHPLAASGLGSACRGTGIVVESILDHRMTECLHLFRNLNFRPQIFPFEKGSTRESRAGARLTRIERAKGFDLNLLPAAG